MEFGVQGIVFTCHSTGIPQPLLTGHSTQLEDSRKWRSNAERRGEQTTSEEPQPFALSLAAET